MGCTTDLPEDLIAHILVRLPVKFLLRLRCVCRSWCALIRNPNFVTHHLRFINPLSPNSSKPRKEVLVRAENCTFSLLSGENLERREPLELPSHPDLHVVGYCDGIVLIQINRKDDFFLWNPATREYKTLPYPIIPQGCDVLSHSVGFGFDPKTSDYKVVRIMRSWVPDEGGRLHKTDLLDPVKLYSLKTDSWREIQSLSAVVPTGLIPCADNYINGCVFWTGCTRKTHGTEKMLLLFDMANEAFKVIDAPVPAGRDGLFTKLNDFSIAFLHQHSKYHTDVWVMNQVGDAGSCWAKQHSLYASLPPLVEQLSFDPSNPLTLNVSGFLNTGELIVLSGPPRLVAACDPLTLKLRKLVQLYAPMWPFVSYKESLVPLRGENVLNLVREPFFSYPSCDEFDEENEI